MSLIERWGVAPLPATGATRLDLTPLYSTPLDWTRLSRTRCGSQLSHNLKLSPERGARVAHREKEGDSGVRVGPMRGTYEGVTRREKRTRPRRRKGHELGGKGGLNRTGASHKHPHNDLCDERPFGPLLRLSRSPLCPPPCSLFPPSFLIPAATMCTCILSRHSPPSAPLLPPSSAAKRIMRYASLFLPRPILRTLSLARFVSSLSVSLLSLSP